MKPLGSGCSPEVAPFALDPTAYGCRFATRMLWRRSMAVAGAPRSERGASTPSRVTALTADRSRGSHPSGLKPEECGDGFWCAAFPCRRLVWEKRGDEPTVRWTTRSRNTDDLLTSFIDSQNPRVS
jgi:hypothetical protein